MSDTSVIFSKEWNEEIQRKRKHMRELFNHKVQETKNNLLTDSAEDILFQMQFQYDYREGGIIDLTFDELLTEIAQKKVLGIDCVDGRVTDEHIKEWI